MSDLFSTAMEIEIHKWQKYICHSLDAASEEECAAYGTLYLKDSSYDNDFYVYLEPKCHLGELGQICNSNPEINSTLTKIKIQPKHAKEYVSTAYDSVFTLPDTSLFDSVDFEDSEDLGYCGARCDLHESHCDFFATSETKCYFGSYSQTGGETVLDSDKDNQITTYHKSGMILPLDQFLKQRLSCRKTYQVE